MYRVVIHRLYVKASCLDSDLRFWGSTATLDLVSNAVPRGFYGVLGCANKNSGELWGRNLLILSMKEENSCLNE